MSFYNRWRNDCRTLERSSMKYLIECLSCKKTVWAELHSYGLGYIAQCPVCEDMAYNEKHLPIQPSDIIRAAGQTH